VGHAGFQRKRCPTALALFALAGAGVVAEVAIVAFETLGVHD